MFILLLVIGFHHVVDGFHLVHYQIVEVLKKFVGVHHVVASVSHVATNVHHVHLF